MLPICAIILHLYVEYKTCCGYTCAMWQEYRHLPIMWNVCILVSLVLLLIALISYEVYNICIQKNLCVAFEGHFCNSHAYGNSMVNRICSLFLFICAVYMKTTVVVQGDINVKCYRQICWGAYAIMWNVCIPVLLWVYMRCIYWHSCVMCAHKLICKCGI